MCIPTDESKRRDRLVIISSAVNVDECKLDLIGVNSELIGQLSQRVLALHGRQCHLRLEGW